MSRMADLLEIRIKDSSYRTYYKLITRVSDKKKIIQMIEDLKAFGVNLEQLSKIKRKVNIFGEVIE